MKHFQLVSIVSFFSACIACGGGSDTFEVTAADTGSEASEDTGSTVIVTDTGSSADSGTVASEDTGIAADTAVESPFSPKDLEGMILWLDAAKGIDTSGGEVSAWHDQSGKNNDVAQSDATKRPKTATLSGIPAVQFTPGLFLTRAGDQSLDFNIGKGDTTLAIVARDAGTDKSSIGMLFQKCNQTKSPFAGFQAYMNMDGNHRWAGATAGSGEILKTAASMAIEATHTLVFQRIGLQTALRLDGVEVSKVALSSVIDATSSDPLFVGNRADGFHAASSYVFEIVVIAGSVDPAHTASLESYLLGKYAK